MNSFEIPVYKPPFFSSNPHVQTIATSLFRDVPQKIYTHRERLELDDGDFLDIDWIDNNSSNCIIIFHGLESSSYARYVLGAAQAFSQIQSFEEFQFHFSVAVVNWRGCSGEPNRLLQSYHSGKTDDIHRVIEVLRLRFEKLFAVGFSLGANALLKYCGEITTNTSLTACAVVSAPTDLAASARKLSEPLNYIYLHRFLRRLYRKMEVKSRQFPHDIDLQKFRGMKSFADFDSAYTAPVHGFVSAEEYWNHCSANNYLHSITTPTLFISSYDDPFLSKECYPVKLLEENQYIIPVLTDRGGHVAFMQASDTQRYHERIIMRFFCRSIFC